MRSKIDQLVKSLTNAQMKLCLSETLEQRHKMKIMLLLRKLFDCAVLGLLIWNLVYLTVKYTNYETGTNVAPYFPVKLNVTKLSLCFSIASVLDTEPHGYSFSRHQTLTYTNLTFEQVFKRMPSVSRTLNSCKYRDFDLDVLTEETNGLKCAQLFQVIRFRMQGYMCYRFTFPLAPEYSYHVLANSLYEPRELFRLSIRRPLSNQRIIYPLLHFESFPEDDRVFNEETYRDSASLFQLSYDLYESHSLPSPYETNCARVSKIRCYQKCLAKSQRKLGYSTDTGLTLENSWAASLRLMPAANETDLHLYRSSCYSKCPYESCTQILVNTRVSKIDNPGENLLLIIETVNRLITKIQFLAKFTLIDYITQIGSVVSIWTGISVITLSKWIHPREKVALNVFYFAVKSHLLILRVVLSHRPEGHFEKDHFLVEKSRLRSKLKRVSILANLFKASLLPFFLWQLFNVVQYYFKFQTTAEFNYDLNPQVTIPTIGFCLEYEDLLSIHAMDPTEENYHQLFVTHDSIFNRTMRQLLADATTDGVIDGCFIRDWKSRFKRFRYNNGSSCLRYFLVKKFFSSHKLCYQILPTEKLERVYYQSDIKFLPTNPGIVYSIILGPNVPVPQKLYIVTQFGDDLPLTSVEFWVFIYKSDVKQMISLSNRLYRIKLLEPPYDTFCDPIVGKSRCLEACISSSLGKYKRISYGSTDDRNLDLRFLSYSDLVNDSVNEMWRQTEDLCFKRCWRSLCEYSFTTTTIKDEIPVKNFQKIFAIDLPSHPTVQMTTVPVMVFYNFAYEILCCCSFWLGLSLVALKPKTALAKERAKIEIYLTEVYLVVERVVDKLLKSSHQVSYFQKIQDLEKRKLCNFLFSSSVTLSCLFHIIDSTMIYLSYSSFIDVYELMETRTDVNLLICLDTAELISRKYPSDIEDPVVAKSTFLNRTVTSLFADTPKADQLIRYCGHWGLYNRRANISQMSHVSDRIFFATKNKSVCDQIYEIQKVVIQSYMCYLIRPRNYSYWTRMQMKHTLNKYKMILKVSIDSSLLTKRFTLMVSFAKYVPVTSSSFAHSIIRDPKYDRYVVSYIRYIESLLPSPKTNDGFVPFLFDRCLNHCINRKLRASHNLTLSKRFSKPSRLRFVSYFDRKREEFQKFMGQLQNKCEVKCLEYNDHVMVEKKGNIEIYVPTVQGRRTSKKESDLTSIDLKSTNHPVLSIKFKLKISLFQHVINLGSILGLWFGFSAISLARMSSIRQKKIGLPDLYSLDKRTRSVKTKYNL